MSKHPPIIPVFCRWRFSNTKEVILCMSNSCGQTLSLDALGEPFAAAALDPRPRPWKLCENISMPPCAFDKK